MKTYTVQATRSGRWWAITIDEDPRAQTQARRLDQVESMARSVLADLDALGPDEAATFTVTAHAADLEALRRSALQAKAVATKASEDASRTAREFARTASEQGLPVRDIGALLGVTHQRAQQLLTA
jgi:hypothetical protein